jgi:aminoglycoside phosphotransferase (APT) family kinase protein
MLYDTNINDACFAEGRPPAEIEAVLEWAHSRLAPRPPWKLISARRKLGRTLFEIEEERPSGPVRLIGKLGNADRAASLYATLKWLRDAGFAPPAYHTVPEPLAFISDRGFTLQEKVPGQQAAHLLMTNQNESRLAATESAKWLAALHRCGIPAATDEPNRSALSIWANDLASFLPSESRRIERIVAAIHEELAVPISNTVPCHGDFHPMNIFIARNERVTGIDIDKLAAREPESDVAWFLMQTAAFGYFEKHSFESTREARSLFIESYEAAAQKRLCVRRTALYMAMAFLKNLHFELVLLKTGRNEYADPWLSGAAAAIVDVRLSLEP